MPTAIMMLPQTAGSGITQMWNRRSGNTGMRGSPLIMEIMDGWSMILPGGILKNLRITGFSFPVNMIPVNCGISKTSNR